MEHWLYPTKKSRFRVDLVAMHSREVYATHAEEDGTDIYFTDGYTEVARFRLVDVQRVFRIGDSEIVFQ